MRRFYFKLALSLGCTVKELLTRIDSHELTEWVAYDSIDPFGETRADIRQGYLTSAFYNANSKKGAKQLTPKDFIIGDTSKRRPSKQTPQEMASALSTIFGAPKNSK
jgi:hypothetical protein